MLDIVIFLLATSILLYSYVQIDRKTDLKLGKLLIPADEASYIYMGLNGLGCVLLWIVVRNYYHDFPTESGWLNLIILGVPYVGILHLTATQITRGFRKSN